MANVHCTSYPVKDYVPVRCSKLPVLQIHAVSVKTKLRTMLDDHLALGYSHIGKFELRLIWALLGIYMTSNKTTIVGLPLATLQAAGAPLKKKIGFRCSEKEPDSRDRRKKLKRALKRK